MSDLWVIILSMGAATELLLDHPVDPGWDLDELFDLEPGEYPADGLFTAITAVAKAEAMLHAKKLELLAALHTAKRDDDDVEWLADTVAADNHTTIARARGELELARKLTTRLPQTLRLLAAGKLDVPRVRQLDELTVGLSDEHCAELEAGIFPLAVDKPRGSSPRWSSERSSHSTPMRPTSAPSRQNVTDACASSPRRTGWPGSPPTSPPRTPTPPTPASTPSPAGSEHPPSHAPWTNCAPTSFGTFSSVQTPRAAVRARPST